MCYKQGSIWQQKIGSHQIGQWGDNAHCRNCVRIPWCQWSLIYFAHFFHCKCFTLSFICMCTDKNSWDDESLMTMDEITIALVGWFLAKGLWKAKLVCRLMKMIKIMFVWSPELVVWWLWEVSLSALHPSCRLKWQPPLWKQNTLLLQLPWGLLHHELCLHWIVFKI